MKKIILLIAITVLVISFATAQQNKLVPMKLCDTDLSRPVINPCLIPVYTDGKLIGYQQHNFPYALGFKATPDTQRTTSAFTSFIRFKIDTNEFTGYTLAEINFYAVQWLRLTYGGQPAWWIDNPVDNKGRFIIHNIDRKRFKWLNNHTAIYSPKKIR